MRHQDILSAGKSAALVEVPLNLDSTLQVNIFDEIDMLKKFLLRETEWKKGQRLVGSAEGRRLNRRDWIGTESDRWSRRRGSGLSCWTFHGGCRCRRDRVRTGSGVYEAHKISWDRLLAKSDVITFVRSD